MIHRYLLVGGITTASYFIIFQILLHSMNLSIFAATTIAYSIFISMNFSMHRCITFNAREQSLKHNFMRYLISFGMNYVLTLLIIHTMTKILGWTPEFGLLAAIAVTTITGFLLSKFWVYSCDT